MKLITTLITVMATIICLVTGTMLDSENPAPVFVCLICLAWLVAYALAKTISDWRE